MQSDGAERPSGSRSETTRATRFMSWRARRGGTLSHDEVQAGNDGCRQSACGGWACIDPGAASDSSVRNALIRSTAWSGRFGFVRGSLARTGVVLVQERLDVAWGEPHVPIELVSRKAACTPEAPDLFAAHAKQCRHLSRAQERVTYR
ncbi:MAG: hypothetical protein JWL76_1459 [Thermoleophilia bacterium]|nr:hypothetical protein [Thermoleophilia bacterium]